MSADGRKRSGRRTKDDTSTTQLKRRTPIYEFINESDLDLIHEKTMEVLSEIGIDFYLDEALEILSDHGAKVDGETVTFPPGLVEEHISKAPSQFTQLARNPDQNIIIGGDYMVFAPVYGPPFVYDLEGGRREATMEDFQNFIKLAYLSPYIHHSGGTIVEPCDEPAETRHLDMLFSHIKYSDKPFMGSVMSGEMAEDSVKMAEILFGAEKIRQDPALISLINVSSPRRLDERMLSALTVYARARQAVVITPFIVAGAMSPVSMAGTLIQQNAEALAGLTYAQMVEPGAPVVYGSFTTNADMKSGAPVFGSPESQMALFASAQLARRYNLPFRGGGMFASSKITDAQAAYESVMTMLPALQAGIHFVLHAAGWLENGLSAGYEKFVLDCDVLGMLHTLAKGIDFSEESLAMDSLREVEPGGHHLGTAHTMRHYADAFYRAEIFDYDDYEQWLEKGGKDATEGAAGKVKELLESYQAPELAEDLEEELQDFINRRKAELTE